VDALDFSPDPKRTMLLTGSADKTAKVWEIQEPKTR
jgi:WD40 repeat protein